MLKRLVITRGATADIAALARAGYPFEICGALIGQIQGETATANRVREFPNTADEARRRRRFEIDPVLILRLERELRGSADALIGFYHSHPDHPPIPSATDLEYFRLWPQTVWLIASVQRGEAGESRAWCLDPSGSSAVEVKMDTRE